MVLIDGEGLEINKEKTDLQGKKFASVHTV